MLDWDSLRYFLEVARTQRASAAARKLGVEHTTVSRRIRALEAELDTLLFESRAARLRADRGRPAPVRACRADGKRGAQRPRKPVWHRPGAVGTPAHRRHRRVRQLCADAAGGGLPASLSAHHAGHPAGAALREPVQARSRPGDHHRAAAARAYVCSKLCDYTLRLYGTPGYLARHPPIRSRADGGPHVHRLCGRTAVQRAIALSGGSAASQQGDPAQHQRGRPVPRGAARPVAGHPALLHRRPGSRLTPVLEQEVEITRSFWMYCHEDLRKLKRVNVLWEFIRKSALRNAGLLAGTQTRCATCPRAAGSRQGLRKPRGCCAAPSLAAGASAGRMSAAPPGRESPRRPRRS